MIIVCNSCSKQIRSDYLACPHCGDMAPNVSAYEICPSCRHVIPENEPCFCPYCLHQIREIKKMEEKAEVPIKEEVIDDIEEIAKVDREHLIKAIKMDRVTIHKIMNSEDFNLRGLQLVFLSGITFGLVILLTNIVFQQGSISGSIKDTLVIGIVQPLAFIFTAFFLRVVLNGMDKTMDTWKLMNLFSSSAPLFILKDLLILPIALYIYTFEGSAGGGLLGVILSTLTVIAFLYLVIMIGLVIHHTIQSYFVTFLVVFFTLGLGAIMTFAVAAPIISILMDMII